MNMKKIIYSWTLLPSTMFQKFTNWTWFTKNNMTKAWLEKEPKNIFYEKKKDWRNTSLYLALFDWVHRFLAILCYIYQIFLKRVEVQLEMKIEMKNKRFKFTENKTVDICFCPTFGEFSWNSAKKYFLWKMTSYLILINCHRFKFNR